MLYQNLSRKQAHERVRSAIILLPLPIVIQKGEEDIPLAYVESPDRKLVLRPNHQGVFTWWALDDLHSLVFVECNMTRPSRVKFDLAISTEINTHVIGGILRTGVLGVTPNETGDMTGGLFYEFPVNQQVIDMVVSKVTRSGRN